MQAKDKFAEIVSSALSQHQEKIDAWFAQKTETLRWPFYGSVDIRDSGEKITLVDCNLYPGGFNNISQKDRPTASAWMREDLLKWARDIGQTFKSVLILPEAHTQNPYYADHLESLIEILRGAGFFPMLGWYAPEMSDSERVVPVRLKTTHGSELLAFPVRCNTLGELTTEEGRPDVVLLNNDFSSGYPRALDCVQQLIVPAYTMGWHTRKKSEHFKYFNRFVAELAELLGLPADRFQVATAEVDGVDFQTGSGMESLKETVDRMLKKLVQNRLGTLLVNEAPFVFVKSNAGTYGMGISVMRDAAEVFSLNRREKNKMSVIKNGRAVESVIVQEGIPTQITYQGQAAEPVLYLAGGELVGLFLRYNHERDATGNLNSRGMGFAPLPLEHASQTLPNLGIYRLLAKVALLAMSAETKDHPYSEESYQIRFL